jgi:hypothetical protein
MNGRLYYLGFNHGWKLAAHYTNGTRAERRAIRCRLSKVSESYSAFIRGVWYGFRDFAEQRADAIQAGVAPRCCNPHKLRRVLDRV